MAQPLFFVSNETRPGETRIRAWQKEVFLARLYGTALGYPEQMLRARHSIAIRSQPIAIQVEDLGFKDASGGSRRRDGRLSLPQLGDGDASRRRSAVGCQNCDFPKNTSVELVVCVSWAMLLAGNPRQVAAIEFRRCAAGLAHGYHPARAAPGGTPC